MGGKSDTLGIVQETEICPYFQMVFAQTRICTGEGEEQNSLI